MFEFGEPTADFPLVRDNEGGRGDAVSAAVSQGTQKSMNKMEAELDRLREQLKAAEVEAAEVEAAAKEEEEEEDDDDDDDPPQLSADALAALKAFAVDTDLVVDTGKAEPDFRKDLQAAAEKQREKERKENDAKPYSAGAKGGPLNLPQPQGTPAAAGSEDAEKMKALYRDMMSYGEGGGEGEADPMVTMAVCAGCVDAGSSGAGGSSQATKVTQTHAVLAQTEQAMREKEEQLRLAMLAMDEEEGNNKREEDVGEEKERGYRTASGAIVPVPKDNKDYKTHKYWEERFAVEEERDWLGSYDHVQLHLQRFLPEMQASIDSGRKILVVGCGNSPFSIQLHDDLQKHSSSSSSNSSGVLSIDFSVNVIKLMRERHPHLGWEVMDMTKMSYPSESFDFVLDKAAMDALVTDEGDPWDPNQETCDITTAMMRSVAEVLRPGGVFVQISFQQPHFRKKYLAAAEEEPYNLHFEKVETVDVGLGYFFFILRKKE